MTAELVDIKDREPNEALIDQLELLIEKARAGEVRSAIYAIGFNDDSTSTWWAVDSRQNRRMMLAEVYLAAQDYGANILIADDTGALASAIKGA